MSPEALLTVASGCMVVTATWSVGALGAVVSGGGIFAGMWLADALDAQRGGGDRNGPDGQLRFEEELERARRFGNALALVRVPAAGSEAAFLADPRDRRRASTRRIDVCWIEDSDLYLTLYDTRAEGVELVLDRLEQLGVTTTAAQVAVFPDSALTAGAMRRQVRAIQRSQTPTEAFDGIVETEPPLDAGFGLDLGSAPAIDAAPS